MKLGRGFREISGYYAACHETVFADTWILLDLESMRGLEKRSTCWGAILRFCEKGRGGFRHTSLMHRGWTRGTFRGARSAEGAGAA